MLSKNTHAHWFIYNNSYFLWLWHHDKDRRNSLMLMWTRWQHERVRHHFVIVSGYLVFRTSANCSECFVSAFESITNDCHSCVILANEIIVPKIRANRRQINRYFCASNKRLHRTVTCDLANTFIVDAWQLGHSRIDHNRIGYQVAIAS